MADQRRAGKSDTAFRTISEAADELDLQQHVLRFWESKFPQMKPLKRGGGRRYYRPDDVALLKRLKQLLHHDGYTIKGVQKLLREEGVKHLLETAPTDQPHEAGVNQPSVVPSADDRDDTLPLFGLGRPQITRAEAVVNSQPFPAGLEKSDLAAATVSTPGATTGINVIYRLSDNQRTCLSNVLQDLENLRNELSQAS